MTQGETEKERKSKRESERLKEREILHIVSRKRGGEGYQDGVNTECLSLAVWGTRRRGSGVCVCVRVGVCVCVCVGGWVGGWQGSGSACYLQ